MVEDCRFIDISKLPAPEVFRDHDGRLLHLTATWPTGETIKLTLRTATTSPNYGGQRDWLVCPLCDRRASKLYAPDPSIPFACRACHRLAYRSQYWKRSNFVLIRRWLLRPPSATASARRQRDRRYLKKLDAMSEAQLLTLIGTLGRRSPGK
jgi:hypothetical protein